MNEPTVFTPPPAKYTCATAPPIKIGAEELEQLQRLADAASSPGVAVTVSDLLGEAIADYVASHKKKLSAAAKRAEEEELRRIAAASASVRVAHAQRPPTEGEIDAAVRELKAS